MRLQAAKRCPGRVWPPGAAFQAGTTCQGTGGGDGEQCRRGDRRLVRTAWQGEHRLWRDRDHLADLIPDQLPAAFMHFPVMSGAEENEIFQLIASAVHPVDDVVPVAPRRRPLASRPLA